ncbi:MAG: hypothetical protein K2Z81_24965 [Cyanobacteria bacterium]|nr:hypothetical protein [Cyanobacteriota bacterium]
MSAILSEAFDQQVSTLAFDEAVAVVVPVVGLLSLAVRNVIPEHVRDSELGSRISRELFPGSEVGIDATTFARTMTALIDSAALARWTSTKIGPLLAALKPIVNQEGKDDFASPLLAGWTYQLLQINRNDYAELRASKDLAQLDVLTQWFSPSWISEFLVEEVLANCSSSSGIDHRLTFLDSACGAGHILVPAFHRLVRLQSNRSRMGGRRDNGAGPQRSKTLVEAMESVLTDQVFGLDIDPVMVKLSAFALYLTCRDIDRYAPLSIPHLYHFVAKNEGAFSSPRRWRTAAGFNSEQPTAVSPAEFQVDSITGITSTSNADRIAPASDEDQHSGGHQKNAIITERPGFGSLLLGIEPRTDKIALFSIDGSTIAPNQLPQSFTAQATNPPYLSHRSMPKELCAFLRKHYPGCQYDIYAAFLELSIRLMNKDAGRLSMICQQSFLNIQRYESLRRSLMSRCSIKTIVQLGPGSFASRSGEKVSNTIVSLGPASEQSSCENEISVYNLLDRSSKIAAESQGIAHTPCEKITESVVKKVAVLVPGYPISTACPKEIAHAFSIYPPLESEGTEVFLTNGLFTCNNEKFLRHFSEVSNRERGLYVPYDKGGGQKWFATTPRLIRWDDNGEAIRRYREKSGQARALPGERYYFQPGVTYSYIGTKGFKARLLSPDAIFDIASSAVFSRKLDLFFILGFLNSALVRFMLGQLNPTVNFQIGDLRRLPFVAPVKAVEEKIARLSQDAVELAKVLDRLNPKSPAYAGPALLQLTSLNDPAADEPSLEAAYSELCTRLEQLNRKEQEIQNAIDREIFELYQISRDTASGIGKDRWVQSGAMALATIPTFEKTKSEVRAMV